MRALPLTAVLLASALAAGLQAFELQSDWTQSTVVQLDRIAVEALRLPGSNLDDVAAVVQNHRFLLANHRVTESSPREFVANLINEVQLKESGSLGVISILLDNLLRTAPTSWMDEGSSKNVTGSCSGNAPEVTITGLNEFCGDNTAVVNVNACLDAAKRYCKRVRGVSGGIYMTVGSFTDLLDHRVGVACAAGHEKRFNISPETERIAKENCANTPGNSCLQNGADNYCKAQYGSGYSGIGHSSFMLPSEPYVFYSCFKESRREWVPFSVLNKLTPDCKAVKSANAGTSAFWTPMEPTGQSILQPCFVAASSFCKRFYNHAGGVPQYYEGSEMLISCFAHDYENTVFREKTIDFYDARSSVNDICSLDFQVDSGKILSASPDDLKIETYDNRQSSVELRDSFTISRSLTTENSFSHSHNMKIGTEISVKTGVPFLAKGQVKVSSSYTAELNIATTNTKTTTYSQTSNVVVPPGHAIRKKATITRANMDVPWTAEAVNGLGRVVILSGSWEGVDVSDVFVTQEDL